MERAVFTAVVAMGGAVSAMASHSQMSAAKAASSPPGIVVSVAGSATISTDGMAPGGEVWAEWYSLPPGKAVDETATPVKWASIEMALGGSAVVVGEPAPMCQVLNAGGTLGSASERSVDPGDIEVCNFSKLPGSRTENLGSEPYVFAALAIGGPWKEGMEDAAGLYVKANGLAKAAQVSSSQFGDVEKQILKAGAVRVVISNVTLPPGGRIATTDRYPTLRMVESGELTLSEIPQGSTSASMPKDLAAFDMTDWSPASADKPIVLSNGGEKPVQFVEWTLAPAEIAKQP